MLLYIIINIIIGGIFVCNSTENLIYRCSLDSFIRIDVIPVSIIIRESLMDFEKDDVVVKLYCHELHDYIYVECTEDLEQIYEGKKLTSRFLKRLSKKYKNTLVDVEYFYYNDTCKLYTQLYTFMK